MNRLVNRSLKSLLILTVSTVVWFFVFEFLSTFWIQKFGDPLDRARLVMEPHERYLWRMRPSFSGVFEGKELSTDSAGFRVEGELKPLSSEYQWVVLGPSSAFGWGVSYENTYAALAAKAKGQKLLNASQIGFGVSQGIRLYRDLRERLGASPKTIFIAYGVNDIDRFRFFGPSGQDDESVFSNQEVLAQLDAEKWIYRFAFSSLLVRAIQEGGVRFGCPGAKPLLPRQTEDGFFRSLTELVGLIEADGHRTVIIDSPIHYEFEVESERARLADVHFQKAHELASSGQCSEARKQFLEGRGHEPHRVAVAVRRINGRLKSLSEEKNWRFVEASALLTAKEHFIDPVHFSEIGHQIVSEGVLREIER